MFWHLAACCRVMHSDALIRKNICYHEQLRGFSVKTTHCSVALYKQGRVKDSKRCSGKENTFSIHANLHRTLIYKHIETYITITTFQARSISAFRFIALAIHSNSDHHRFPWIHLTSCNHAVFIIHTNSKCQLQKFADAGNNPQGLQ